MQFTVTSLPLLTSAQIGSRLFRIDAALFLANAEAVLCPNAKSSTDVEAFNNSINWQGDGLTCSYCERGSVNQVFTTDNI